MPRSCPERLSVSFANIDADGELGQPLQTSAPPDALEAMSEHDVFLLGIGIGEGELSGVTKKRLIDSVENGLEEWSLERPVHVDVRDVIGERPFCRVRDDDLYVSCAKPWRKPVDVGTRDLRQTLGDLDTQHLPKRIAKSRLDNDLTLASAVIKKHVRISHRQTPESSPEPRVSRWLILDTPGRG